MVRTCQARDVAERAAGQRGGQPRRLSVRERRRHGRRHDVRRVTRPRHRHVVLEWIAHDQAGIEGVEHLGPAAERLGRGAGCRRAHGPCGAVQQLGLRGAPAGGLGAGEGVAREVALGFAVGLHDGRLHGGYVGD